MIDSPQPLERTRPPPAWVLFFGMVAVAAAYWVGLRGPLLLDDFGNLADVIAWLDGERTWMSVVLNNRSGIGGRPLSMLSFLLDASLWGKDTWHFKFSNLLLHLACALPLYALYRRLLARDPQLSQVGPWLACGLAVLWLALPIHVSSVLYIVQRMAILAALFAMLALWLFVVARERLERQARHGGAMLLAGVPILTGLAFLSKENGALVLLLAFAIEVTYFRAESWRRRPLQVRIFFTLFLAIPAGLAILGHALRPERILDGYALRDFSLLERLLTQPRILWDYVGSIFVPYTPKLGIFHDNYPKSTDLWTPWTTLPAIAAWLLAIAAAWHWRKRHPSILAGLLFYVLGHAIESSVFGLELYFEHRNYLPSVGLLLAGAGVVRAGFAKLRQATPAFRLVLCTLPILLLVVTLLATHGRARVWSRLDTLYAQELKHNPTSPRLRSFVAAEAIQRGDTAAALSHIAVAEAHQNASQRMTVSLWKLLAHCPGDRQVPEALYDEARDRARGQIQTFTMVAWENLAQRIERGHCAPVDVARMTQIVDDWLQQTEMDKHWQQVWRTRYNLARLLASQSRFEEAARQGELAWIDSGYNNGVGVFLFQVNATLGNRDKCEAILQRLKTSYGEDFKLNQAIDSFSTALRNGEI